MKKIFSTFILTLVIIFFVNQIAMAEVKDEEQLYFTYVGPVIGASFNRIVYRDWSYTSSTRKSQVLTGFSLGGGGLLNIYVGHFIGEFSLEYMADINDEERINLQHMFYTSAGKFSWPLKMINDNLSVASGIGVYFESMPSSKDYDGGGGLNFLLGGVYEINREFKLVADFLFRYGYFGIGDDSNKMSFGLKIGVLYKVGRI